MKIALICPDLTGNALVRTYPIAKVLARRHQIQVLGFRWGGDVFAPYRHEFDYDLLDGRRMPAFLLQIRELASRVDADAILAFKPLAASLWVGLLARRMHRIPLFVDVEDWEYGWYLDLPLVDRLKHATHLEQPNSLPWTWLSERLLREADGLYVVSRFLQRRFGGTVLVHGADCTFFDPTRWPRAKAFARLELDDCRYVVFTGTPKRHKGLDDLLDAVMRIDDKGLRVLIVGSFAHDPVYREELTGRYGHRLVLRGSRPHSEMPLCLAAANAVVLPQRQSRVTMAQIPGKVFEAMAMARPIVATDVSDLREILHGCGTVVQPASVDSLAAAISDILDRPGEAEDLGLTARRRCEADYSWDAMGRVLDSTLTVGNER